MSDLADAAQALLDVLSAPCSSAELSDAKDAVAVALVGEPAAKKTKGS